MTSAEFNQLLVPFRANIFDPQRDTITQIPDEAGNYIICLKHNSQLPFADLPVELQKLDDHYVIYTGIASKSLRKRDYRQHFTGNNAGSSTLRKGIGVLLGLKLIPRDKNPESLKTRFGIEDEIAHSNWMNENLTLHFYPNSDYATNEFMHIKHFNPPLNLKDNKNEVNKVFRKQLSLLRSPKTI